MNTITSWNVLNVPFFFLKKQENMFNLYFVKEKKIHKNIKMFKSRSLLGICNCFFVHLTYWRFADSSLLFIYNFKINTKREKKTSTLGTIWKTKVCKASRLLMSADKSV